MIESKQHRTLVSKRFQINNSDSKSQIHIGHIHYFNKLGLGDGEVAYREVDHKLKWDDVKRGWRLEYHSFQSFFPEYSDQIVEFRDLFEDKDRIIKYKASSDRILGKLIETDETNPEFDDNPDNKGVLYKNAFGINKDYILYNTRHKMVKVATINNPNEQTHDAVFEWEIELPGEDIYRTGEKECAEKMKREQSTEVIKDGKILGYKLDKTTTKKFNTEKKTLIGDSKLDGKEWYTYLETYKAWDSDGNTVVIEASLVVDESRLILRKTVPLPFLQSAIGKVFVDTTTSYFSGAGDGQAEAINGWTFAAGRAAATGDAAGYTSIYLRTNRNVGLRDNGASDFEFGRGFLPFDTSSLPDTDTITSAKISLYASVAASDYSAPINAYVIVEGTQASVSQITTADYDQVVFTPALSGEITTAVGDEDSYKDFPLNSSGLSFINKTGYSKFAFIDRYDQLNIEMPSGTHGVRYFSSDQTGTANDPVLEVIHSAGISFIPKTTMYF